MFKRHNQLSPLLKVLYFFWPPTGWRRAWAYTLHRIARFPGSPYSIACGFACGAAVSFTPFVGLHLIVAAILAWILRANIVVSAIGTAVGNPWTFPFIWTWLYQTGTWMTAEKKFGGEHIPKFTEIFDHMLEALLNLDGAYLMETSATIFWPMLLSSIPTGFIIWWLFFLPIKYTVRRYQDSRLHKLTKNISI